MASGIGCFSRVVVVRDGTEWSRGWVFRGVRFKASDFIWVGLAKVV